jgi:haloacetate dehalogenase
VDRDHDDADLGQRRIECALLALWSAGGALPRFYGDVLDVWRPWALDATGWGVDGSHFLVEDQLEQIVDALSTLGRNIPDAPASPVERQDPTCPPTHPPAHSQQTHSPPR